MTLGLCLAKGVLKDNTKDFDRVIDGSKALQKSRAVAVCSTTLAEDIETLKFVQHIGGGTEPVELNRTLVRVFRQGHFSYRSFWETHWSLPKAAFRDSPNLPDFLFCTV